MRPKLTAREEEKCRNVISVKKNRTIMYIVYSKSSIEFVNHFMNYVSLVGCPTKKKFVMDGPVNLDFSLLTEC